MAMAKALTMAAAHVKPIAEARLVGSIAVRRGPISDMAVDPRGSTIVVTNHGDNSVSLLDARALSVQEVVPLDGEPSAVAASAGRAFVSTANPTYDSLSAIDVRTRSFLASLPVDVEIVILSAGYHGKRLFVGGTAGDTACLAVVDVESGRVDVVPVAGADTTVNAIHVAPNGRFVFVATSDSEGGGLAVVDAARGRVVETIPTVAPTRDVVLSTDGSVAHILGCDPQYGGVVETIDTASRRVLATTWIGGCPTQCTLSADGTRLYVVDCDCVVVLCLITNEITDTIDVGAQPSCVATSPHGSRLYVADYSGRVSVFAVASPSSFDDAIDVESVALAGVRELEPATA